MIRACDVEARIRKYLAQKLLHSEIARPCDREASGSVHDSSVSPARDVALRRAMPYGRPGIS